MSNINLIEKIKSRFVIEKIFQYASLSNKFKLKLILYSSACHKKLNINYNDYKYYNYRLSRFSIYEYIYMNFDKFDKNYLFQKAKDKLEENNLTIDDMKNLVIHNIEKVEENKNISLDENKKKKKEEIFLLGNVFPIDIFSPFIEIIISYENDKDFINIPLQYIEQYNLKNDYISFFQKDIKNGNLLYISFDKLSQIEILKELNINFSNINSLYFNCQNKFSDIEYNSFYSFLFSLNNIGNNLENLCLDFSMFNCVITDNDIFEQINNFKSLKNIEFSHLRFDKCFIIKLNNLKIINFDFCENICFENENTIIEVTHLKLYKTNIESGNIVYNLPNLENLNLFDSNIKINYINSYEKLKILEFNDNFNIYDINNFISLEKLIIPYLFKKCNSEDEKDLLDIISKNISLKDVNIGLRKITNEDINKINNINHQIETMKLVCIIDKFDFRSFINKFNNIKTLIFIRLKNNKKNKESFTEIKNDESIKIENFRIFKSSNTTLYFSFSEIKKLYLELNSFDINVFPLFNDKCNFIFNSLQALQIICKDNINEFKIIQNLYNNIDKCRYLGTLQIYLVIPDINETFYFAFIDKIASLKVKNFYFVIQKKLPWDFNLENDYYTFKEIKTMFPNKIYDFYLYKISKYQKP